MNTQSIILLACLLVIAGYAVYNTFFRKRGGKDDCDGNCSGGCGGCCG
ncbi:MAG: FeoB-associated Cys-rich membrane protein [Bacteroidaceae bacterium]|nr:FeoB-associated Cys-rich membrane protein [Bacteroidaceae bacterium]MBO5793773.1 FeoB-associated Cys-rich membrane protein [Bacteroidaceae bacterium]MBQ5654669.1 FeoB-associated Cys-rich membrane protein [Bacteroidaceae bacterium]MBQ5722402.1 FeoB-associated Cys-rich membrane protein [Bacteroidaceae bacterium]